MFEFKHRRNSYFAAFSAAPTTVAAPCHWRAWFGAFGGPGFRDNIIVQQIALTSLGNYWIYCKMLVLDYMGSAWWSWNEAPWWNFTRWNAAMSSHSKGLVLQYLLFMYCANLRRIIACFSVGGHSITFYVSRCYYVCTRMYVCYTTEHHPRRDIYARPFMQFNLELQDWVELVKRVVRHWARDFLQ